MKDNIGKWILVGLLVILLVIVIRGYILKLNEHSEDEEIKSEILRQRLQ